MDLVFRADKSFDYAIALNIVIHLQHPGNPLIRLIPVQALHQKIHKFINFKIIKFVKISSNAKKL